MTAPTQRFTDSVEGRLAALEAEAFRGQERHREVATRLDGLSGRADHLTDGLDELSQQIREIGHVQGEQGAEQRDQGARLRRVETMLMAIAAKLGVEDPDDVHPTA
jgi:hypothetical protein